MAAPDYTPEEMGQLRQFAQSQAYQQLRQQPPVAQSGLFGGLLGGAGSALQGAWSTDAAQPDGYSNQFQPQTYQPSLYPAPPLPTPHHRMIKFFRVNEKVEVPEGAIIEPLDELRIKVAKWLNN